VSYFLKAAAGIEKGASKPGNLAVVLTSTFLIPLAYQASGYSPI